MKRYDIAFFVLAAISAGLLIASFLVPPTGVIDPSVLGAVGEIFGYAALATVIKAIDRGVDATITHKNTSITINNDDNVQK
ncbi:MAG: hypothetical protein IJU13_04200 [Bacteroidales bacterium]|nr:hypothetical protein [Bacteroidales bacterium]